MPEPTDAAPPPPPAPPLPPSGPPRVPLNSGAGRSTWKTVAVVLFCVGVGGRLLLFLIALAAHHQAKPGSSAAVLPTWPLKAGDVFTLRPGDPAIAKWAESPDSDGFVVQVVALNGQPVTDTKVCALEPDYMADSSQPGGTLTLVSQDGTGDWRVHWAGGNTLPVADAPPNDGSAVDTSLADRTAANCGKDATLMMSQAQLHSWLNMQAGVLEAKPAASDQPDSPPVAPAK